MNATPTPPPVRVSLALGALLAGLVLLAPDARAQGSGEPTAYFFPEDQRGFDAGVPSPEEFLGYEIGAHHTRHDRIVAYMRELARVSDRASYRVIGETIELRPMPVLTITSPGNHARLEEIRRRHLEATEPGAELAPAAERPVIVHLGYGVHGNETSSAEAAMLTAYWLVAGESTEVARYLDEGVYHVEPVLNPDGRDRHTHWANMHKGDPLAVDPLDREHNEVWPGGRTNHYWFDLNRDWLPLEQPESRARIDFHHRWRPNVVTDYHEMGTGSTYFFEPSEPEVSWNPLLPERLYTEITPAFAEYWGDALDAIGSRYFNREDRYDNTYPGYGSTYPNFLGGLGLVFEQASSRGHAQAHPTHGVLRFAFPIRNHVRTSLATVRASVERKAMLQEYQRDYFALSLERARDDGVRAWVFGDPHDPSKNRDFLELLLQHRIEVHELGAERRAAGHTFRPGSAWVVPAEQPLYLLARSIFERTDHYTGRAGSRASAWTMTLAYDMPDAAITGGGVPRGDRVTSVPGPEGLGDAPPAAFAYLLDWSDYYAPKALHHLLESGVRAEVALEPFTARTAGGEWPYPAGSVSVPVAAQDLAPDELNAVIREAEETAGAPFQTTATSSTLPDGIDLGSDYVRPIRNPKVLMPIGAGASGYEAGEVWHLLDTRVGMPVTKVDRMDLDRVPLEEYDVLILVSGAERILEDEGMVEEVEGWVRRGGTLVALRTAAHWAARSGLAPHVSVSDDEDGEAGPEDRIDYDRAEALAARQRIAGAMVEVDVDPTHPIGFGLHRRRMAVWRNHNLVLPPSDNPFSTVARYTDRLRLSGFLSEENTARLRGTASVLADELGRGSVILLLDNPNFRGFWYGSNRLFLNALFYGDKASVPATP